MGNDPAYDGVLGKLSEVLSLKKSELVRLQQPAGEFKMAMHGIVQLLWLGTFALDLEYKRKLIENTLTSCALKRMWICMSALRLE